jgi:hypothetical protein
MKILPNGCHLLLENGLGGLTTAGVRWTTSTSWKLNSFMKILPIGCHLLLENGFGVLTTAGVRWTASTS